ncbi:hypothetical protein LY78DRAFT_530809, partial [Colletotrichum sublineola]
MSDPFKYTIGWICTTTTEYFAAKCLLDEEHQLPDNFASRDNNIYTLGRIGAHHVVIAAPLPFIYATNSPATVTQNCQGAFRTSK